MKTVVNYIQMIIVEMSIPTDIDMTVYRYVQDILIKFTNLYNAFILLFVWNLKRINYKMYN